MTRSPLRPSTDSTRTRRADELQQVLVAGDDDDVEVGHGQRCSTTVASVSSAS